MTSRNVICNEGPTVIARAMALVMAVLMAAMADGLASDRIVLATGAKDGAYYQYGLRYREALAQEGVTVEVRETRGTLENLALLRDPASGVNAALIQAGLAGPDDTKDLETLGTVFYEPLWLFGRRGVTTNGVGGLRGKTVAIGPDGSGTQELVRTLLTWHDIDARTTPMLRLNTAESLDRLQAGTIDAAFFVASWDAPDVQRLLDDNNVELSGYPQAGTYIARAPYLNKVVLPRGMRSLPADQPPTDITLVAPKASLAVRKDLPARLQFQLLLAVKSIHSRAGIFHTANQFPSDETFVLNLSSAARGFYKQDLPFLYEMYNQLPTWFADLISPVVMFFSVIGLVVVASAIRVLSMGIPVISRFGIWIHSLPSRRKIGLAEEELRRIKQNANNGSASGLRADLHWLEEHVHSLTVAKACMKRLNDLRHQIDIEHSRQSRIASKQAEGTLAPTHGPDGVNSGAKAALATLEKEPVDG